VPHLATFTQLWALCLNHFGLKQVSDNQNQKIPISTKYVNWIVFLSQNGWDFWHYSQGSFLSNKIFSFSVEKSFHDRLNFFEFDNNEKKIENLRGLLEQKSDPIQKAKLKMSKKNRFQLCFDFLITHFILPKPLLRSVWPNSPL
jgi:hypothetical protein